jgi:hypothetical protein
MKAVFVNKKRGVPLTVTLQDGTMADFPAGKYVTDEERVIAMLDRHPNNGRTFVREHREPKPQAEPPKVELTEVAEVTTAQQAAEWLAENLEITGITSKAKAHKAAADNGYAFPNL